MLLPFPSSNLSAKRKILVVDDEKIIADTLELILLKEGYEVRKFYRAKAALNALASFIPELVVGDVILPDKYGFEMATEIKRRIPSIQILLLSGQVATSKLMDEARLAQVELLSKPVSPRDLIQKVEQMLNVRKSNAA